jgi:DNA-binding transcriptional regulator GbsR (MarR family)
MDNTALERFVEEAAMQMEFQAGTPRMVGRVWGWLLVCDPPEQSAADLVESLQASKGSISTATRTLLTMGLIERIRLRGERFDRFRVRPEAMDEAIWREDQFTAPHRVIRMGLDALAGAPADRRQRLEELDWMYAWWEDRIGKLRQEYLADRRRAQGEQDKGGIS